MVTLSHDGQGYPNRVQAKVIVDSSPIRLSCRLQRNESAGGSRYGHRESEGAGRGVRLRARCAFGKPRPTGVVSRKRSLRAAHSPTSEQSRCVYLNHKRALHA